LKIGENSWELQKMIIEPFSSKVRTPHIPLIQGFQTQEKYSSEKIISSKPESSTILQKASATQSINVKLQPEFTIAFNPQTLPAWT